MADDLTDAEMAAAVRKHKRTIQRWCKSGKLPGAYKAGRSWRIPRRTAREAHLGGALSGDDAERELESAIALCQQLAGEIEGGESVGGVRLPTVARNWRRIAYLLQRLETELGRLPTRPGAVPR